ncbi:MAG: thiamine diphosphokinase [Sphaerochaetaceae bacterium]|nr:thiamine diphosphokinase [Sphaerochaetaceae bacterium]
MDNLTLVLTGGEGPVTRPSFEYNRIIAADSGADLAFSLGYTPTEVIGDFDSTRERETLETMGYKACPRDKDYSDTELALKLVEKERYDLFGGGGGRVDHLVSLLGLFDTYPLPRIWLTKEDVMISLTGNYKFTLPVDEDVSFFPATKKSATISTSGLVWDMQDKELSHSWISLSNRVKKPVVSINVEGLVFMRLKAGLISCIESQI